MAEGDVRVPAGWYPDPLGLPQLRWWDNHSWTEYTSDARQPMVAQETVTQQPRLTYADDEETLSRRERRERESAETPATAPAAAAAATATDGVGTVTTDAKPTQEALLALEAPSREDQVVVEEELSPAAKFAEFVPANAPTTPAFDLGTRFDDLLGSPSEAGRAGTPAPAASASAAAPAFDFEAFEATASAPAASAETPTATAAPVPHTTGRGSSTAPAWVIAMMPLFGLLAAMFALVAQIGAAAAAIVPITTLLVPYLVSIPLALADWRMLTARGMKSAHWLFALLGPGYLIARFVVLVRSTGRGFGPLLGGIGFALLNVVAVVALPGLVIASAPAEFSHAVEQSVAEQATTLGADIQVTCPEDPPTIVGQSFTCTAKRNANDLVSWGITVSLQRANGWFSWRVDDWGIFTVGGTGQSDSGS